MTWLVVVLISLLGFPGLRKQVRKRTVVCMEAFDVVLLGRPTIRSSERMAERLGVAIGAARVVVHE